MFSGLDTMIMLSFRAAVMVLVSALFVAAI